MSNKERWATDRIDRLTVEDSDLQESDVQTTQLALKRGLRICRENEAGWTTVAKALGHELRQVEGHPVDRKFSEAVVLAVPLFPNFRVVQVRGGPGGPKTVPTTYGVEFFRGFPGRAASLRPSRWALDRLKEYPDRILNRLAQATKGRSGSE